MTKRKSPIRHRVRTHKRIGKTVNSFIRGSGQKTLKIANPIITKNISITYDKMHQSQLIRMQKAGIKDATLVLVDMHDDMTGSETPEDFKPYLWTKSWEEDPDAQGRWVIPAIKKGLIKKIVFVIPDIKIDTIHRKGNLVMKNFKKENDKEVGEVHGIPVLITKLNEMSQVTGRNTVLSIDADFLGESEEHWGVQDRWISPTMIARELKQKVPNPKLVSFFRSKDYLRLELEGDANTLFAQLKRVYGGKKQ